MNQEENKELHPKNLKGVQEFKAYIESRGDAELIEEFETVDFTIKSLCNYGNAQLILLKLEKERKELDQESEHEYINYKVLCVFLAFALLFSLYNN